MSNRFFIITLALFSIWGAAAQQGSPSPYSFFGLGLNKFKGTVENRSMGGISTYSDSIHINLQNPAGYGALRLTTYAIAGSHKSVSLKSNSGTDQVTNSTLLEYLAIGLPAGRWGFGFGLVPFSSVGYEVEDLNGDLLSKYSGSGGLNRVYFSTGYRISNGLRIGATANYNFGNIQNKALFHQDNIQYGTQEINRSDLNGFTFNFGAQYQKMITDKLELTGSASYSFSSDLTSKNERQIATVIISPSAGNTITDLREVAVPESTLQLPSIMKLGAGIGAPRQWFIGLEYGRTDASDYSNRSYSVSNVSYTQATRYAIGGFYIPDYRNITSYFSRIVYRAGLRYEETGLTINNEAIDEFGMSFGVGLPVGQKFSNINIGFEYGQRGTTEANLIEETFYGAFISLSFNDLWFQEKKYN